MQTLYELTGDYLELQDLLSSVDTTDAQYRQIYLDTLESIKDSIEVKAEGYAMIDRQLDADATVVKNEMDRLAARYKAIQNNRKNLKDSLFQSMLVTGNKKIKTPLFSIWIQNNPPKLDIQSEQNIPKDFFVQQEPTLNKRELMNFVKSNPIKGVNIIQEQSLRIK